MASVGKSGSILDGEGGAVAGLTAVVIGACVSVAIGTASHWSGATAFSVAFLAQLAGFLALGIAARGGHALRPFTLSLAIGTAGTLLALLFLPIPTGGRDRAPAIVVASALISQLVALWAKRARPRVAAVAVAALGAFAIAGLYVRLRQVGMNVSPAGGDHLRVSILIATFVWSAWIASLWHGRSLWRAPAASETL